MRSGGEGDFSGNAYGLRLNLPPFLDDYYLPYVEFDDLAGNTTLGRYVPPLKKLALNPTFPQGSDA